jgi:hypothetical protein
MKRIQLTFGKNLPETQPAPLITNGDKASASY